mmetsp:Transcript_2166/g.14249  ORF Transcript_2166/g.14249 Transcript_2166/m.14249 type:complete len:220 (+) Transcript_2166:1009-1668(+)
MDSFFRPAAEDRKEASIEFLANIRGGHRHPHRAAMASQDVATIGQRTSHIRNKMRRSEVYGKLLHEKKVCWNQVQPRNDDETRGGWVDRGCARLTSTTRFDALLSCRTCDCSGRSGSRGRSWPKSEKRRSKLDRCRRRSQNRRRWRTQERRTIPSSDPTTKKSEKIWPTTSSPSTSIVKSRPKCCSPQEGNPPPSCSSSLPTCCTCSQTPPITNGTTTK